MHARICGGETVLALASVTDFGWDEVVILTPHTSGAQANAVLGFPWAEYFLHRDALASEAEDVLIFLKEGRIVRVVDHARADGDFADTLAARRISRKAAIFTVAPQEAGYEFARLELLAKQVPER